MATPVPSEIRRFTAEQVGLGFECPEVRKPVTAVQPLGVEVTA